MAPPATNGLKAKSFSLTVRRRFIYAEDMGENLGWKRVDCGNSITGVTVAFHEGETSLRSWAMAQLVRRPTQPQVKLEVVT